MFYPCGNRFVFLVLADPPPCSKEALFPVFLDALASLELVMSVGYTIFHEIFDHGVTGTLSIKDNNENLTTLQCYNLTT